MLENNVRCVFRNVLDESSRFRNCKYIHPIKQRKIAEAIVKAKSNINVRRLAVFGSSVTEYCFPWSDIDVVVWDSTHSFTPPFNDEYDVLYSDQINKDSILCNEICKKGIIIYERDDAGNS